MGLWRWVADLADVCLAGDPELKMDDIHADRASSIAPIQLRSEFSNSFPRERRDSDSEMSWTSSRVSRQTLTTANVRSLQQNIGFSDGRSELPRRDHAQRCRQIVRARRSSSAGRPSVKILYFLITPQHEGSDRQAWLRSASVELRRVNRAADRAKGFARTSRTQLLSAGSPETGATLAMRAVSRRTAYDPLPADFFQHTPSHGRSRHGSRASLNTIVTEGCR